MPKVRNALVIKMKTLLLKSYFYSIFSEPYVFFLKNKKNIERIQKTLAREMLFPWQGLHRYSFSEGEGK